MRGISMDKPTLKQLQTAEDVVMGIMATSTNLHQVQAARNVRNTIDQKISEYAKGDPAINGERVRANMRFNDALKACGVQV